MKRWLYIAAVFGGCAAALWGCGRRQAEQHTEESITEAESSRMGWEAYAGDSEELEWYVNYSWFTTGWGENLVSKKITEETGTSISFVTPVGNATEKLNSMIAADTLPDLITLGWWEPQVDELVKRDMVYSLDELADQYDPYFYEVINKDKADWYRDSDGELYCYPSSSFTPQDYEKYDTISSNQNFLVRKDIYEAIGSPDMTTPEGFSEAVRAAAEMFPKVDGQPLIPIGAEEFGRDGCNTFGKYLQNFLAVPYEKDGEVYDRFTDPEYIRWMKTFRQLGEEGYLADDIFVDRRSQIEEKIVQGRYFCILCQGADMLTQEKTLYAKNPDSIYIAVDGPKNSAGDDPMLPGGGINGWTLTFISKNCKNPGRAISFLSYLISEHGQKLTYLGVEGEMYDVVDGEIVIRPEVQKLLETDRAEYDRLYGADDTYWMLQDNVMQMQWGSWLSGAERQIKEWTYPYTIYAGQYEFDLDSDTEEAGIDLKVQQEWGKILPMLLLAESDEEFDRIMQEFQAKKETYGYDKVLDAMTEQMKEYKKVLGLE